MAKISLIAAIGKNRELGKANRLLWNIPDDLKNFSHITTGHPVIMGQKTFDSIGRPLPKRNNIVLSLDKDLKIEGCDICHSLDDAITLASKYDKEEIFVIGGGSVYAQSIGKANKLYLTLVDEDFDADVYFPEYNEFREVKSGPWQESNGLKFKFTELERNKNVT